jgi:hypothetical protein
MTTKVTIGSRWRFKDDDRIFVVSGRRPGGFVEYRQEDRAVFGMSHLRHWLENAEQVAG